jgi:NAD(P)-dependent dehydrogenase (short-subunit alcohol dehydrogenase family)
MDLGQGTVAVVTGGASGIGLALADALATAGCDLVLGDVQEDALAAAGEQVARHGGGVLTVRTDVSRQDQVEALAAATLEQFGTVHVVCNNAGVGSGGDPWFGPIETWQWTMGVNFWGVVHGVRAFLPHLVAAGRGHIVNTASILGLMPAISPVYDASKHAVVALTEDLYHTVRTAELPVGVSCLCPGWVRTGISESDRNWPDELGPRPTRDAAAEVSRKYVTSAIDEGMQPGAVADLVVDAIRRDRYWILPSPDFFELAVERFHRIAEQADPVPPQQLPGMPPRDQILAEIAAAMSRQEPPS